MVLVGCELIFLRTLCEACPESKDWVPTANVQRDRNASKRRPGKGIETSR